MSVKDKQAYHRLITDSYDARSKTYADSVMHRDVAQKLVDRLPPGQGHRVLDAGTGTGNVAFHAAMFAGPAGEVIGVDISTGMIARANELLRESAHANIRFEPGDAEDLSFAPASFDRIYCASAFFWMAEKHRTLQHWHELLKPGGVVGFHAWPEDSYVFAHVARQVLLEYGIEYLAHTPYGSRAKCEALLENAGFGEIIFIEDSAGSYITLEEAKDGWIDVDHYPMGQYPHPVANVPEDILAQARADYDAEMERLNTAQGIWNNTSMYYVYGRKQE